MRFIKELKVFVVGLGEQKIKAELALGGKGTAKGYSDLNHLPPLWVFCCQILYSGGLCELSNVIKVNVSFKNTESVDMDNGSQKSS